MLKTQSWQNALSCMITDPVELLRQLHLPETLLPVAQRAHQLFPLRVTHSFVQRIQPGNCDDPLLRQVLPLDIEEQSAQGFVLDPLQEKQANPLSGLLHKYHGRVLLTLTSSCAIHCRYCFRRHFPYKENNPGRQGWQAVWDYIQQNPDIHEVILSGGDPLMATDQVLNDVIDIIAAIPHVKTLRLHTRLPIVLPERITDTLCTSLERTRLNAVCVIHCNHTSEIDTSVSDALKKLNNAGIILLNQSVLLKGVNDNADTLIALSHALFSQNVMPYYLHQLDRVAGTQHFWVPINKAKKLIATCRAQLPGYLVPRYVVEKPGETSKTIIA